MLEVKTSNVQTGEIMLDAATSSRPSSNNCFLFIVGASLQRFDKFNYLSVAKVSDDLAVRFVLRAKQESAIVR